MSQTVALLDDDEAVLDSLAALLEINGLQSLCFSSAPAFLDELETIEADCFLIDLGLPKMSGQEVLEIAQTVRPTVPAIILTGHGNVPAAVQAMRAGALDFIEKPYSEETLMKALREALQRARNTQESQLEQAAFRITLLSLTPREEEVCRLICEGHSSKEIARLLEISPRTVEVHRARVMEKTGAANLSDLVRRRVLAESGD
jgi:two-component system response regulator FixJ